MNYWGQATKNEIGWGQASKNLIGWGSISFNSWSAQTNLIG